MTGPLIPSTVHVDHCDRCVRPIRCRRALDCPLVACVNKACPHVMHACKQSDHRAICRQEQIHCLNRLFGCEQRVRRDDLWRHLVTCCASVVVCTRQWTRAVVERRGLGSGSDLGVALVRRDERIFKKDKQKMALDFSLALSPPLEGAIEGALSLSLDLSCVQNFAKTAANGRLEFKCGQPMRRDEFHAHAKHVHDDLIGQLDGWVEQRCPLFQYGCDFKATRWQPEAQHVVFDETRESFGVKSACEEQLFVRGQHVVLADLPFEILTKIFFFCDAFSLNQLSLTCQRFRHVCHTLLDTRGLVALQWTQQEDRKWLFNRRVWFFSNAFSPVSRWRMTAPQISDHLKTCPHFVRAEKSLEPILLPKVLTEEKKKFI